MGATATFPANQSITIDQRVQLWTSRRQRSQELKQLHEPTWLQAWQWYTNVVEPLTDAADWWRSNEAIPTPFKIVETLFPRYVTGMFDSPDWFTVEAQAFHAEEYESLVQALLRVAVEEMNIFPKIYEALRYSTITGHAWGKVIWREDYETRQVMRPVQITNRQLIEDNEGKEAARFAEEEYGPGILDQPSGVVGMQAELVEEEVHNGPDFEWLPLDRVFPDPSGRGRFYLEEIHTTLEEIEETQEMLGVYDEQQLNALRGFINLKKSPGQTGGLDHLGDARSGTTAGVSIEYAREPETTLGIPEWIITPMRDGTGVSLWQCWGWVPKEQRGDDNMPWRLVVLAEGKFILRDEPSPTPDGKPPYFPIKSIAIPNRLYGETILTYVGPLADQQTRLANMRLDEVFLGVWQQYLFRKNAVVSDNALLMQPGGAIEVNPEPNQSIQDTFMVLPRRPVMPDAFNEDSYRQTQAEHVAAATDIMQGVDAGARTTATEVERRLQQGSARHFLQVMYNDYTVKRELLKRTWKWLQMRLTQPKIVRIAGDKAAMVDLTMLQHPVDIVVGGGLLSLSKDTRLQMDQELLQLSADPFYQQYLKARPILERWMSDRGWKNPDKFLKTEEELMYEQFIAQQAAMQGQAQEQMQGPTPQGMSPDSQPPPGQPGGPGGGTPADNFRVPEMPLPGQEASLAGGPPI